MFELLSVPMFADTDDQDVFEQAAARYLATHYPVERVRALGRADTVFETQRWREGAELGWTSLLVPEDAGGGSISGNGLSDLLIVAGLFGRHAAPGPLLGCNLVAGALGRWGSEAHADVLAALMSGDAVATWGHRSACAATPTAGGGAVLTGRIPTVESATDAGHALVRAAGPDGPTCYLVPLDRPGITVTPLRGVDQTRRFSDLTLTAVELDSAALIGEPGGGDTMHDELLDLAAVLALGEMAGAFQHAFDITREWVASRYSFGRPLDSYQEIKHRMADLRTELEATEAIAWRSAAAVGSGAANGRELACAGMVHAGRRVPEGIQDCIQLHGGIGVTHDSDLHLFLRRAVLDANLYGTPTEFARRLGRLIAATIEGDAA